MNLDEGLSTLGWRVGMSVGIVLSKLLWENPAQCEWQVLNCVRVEEWS